MTAIRTAIVGIGNCASALIQGVHFYREHGDMQAQGLMHWDLGGYLPSDVEVVAAFDIDRRKVGRDVGEAIFQPPNCTKIFHRAVPRSGTIVQMGRLLDGIPAHMNGLDEDFCFAPSTEPEAGRENIIDVLRESGAEILVNFLPVGSQQATEFYVECALAAEVAVVNCIPVFIASDPEWARRFAAKGLPLIGDDVKSQLGATIVHRVLTDLFRQRGVELERTYQLNTGGNTDFLNMLDRTRLASKKVSKTEAVQAVAAKRLEDRNIHIGPSDYVPWQRDNKIGFIRMEGTIFGAVPIDLELRLSVEDSPNSAGSVIDMIRCARLALDRRQAGVLRGPSACFCKHPPEQFTDDEAFRMVSKFISGPPKKLTLPQALCTEPEKMTEPR
ncbi:MAG: inositol-3-phosphate synthase [Desulfofustis sp.]|nr:inositol-3-phosphate synthase [Desulfofustis sp.]